MFTAGQFFKYTLLPGIVPRMREFVTSGLGPIPGLVAQIFRAARLLPPGHAYLLSGNNGKFGLRHVLLAAWNNIQWRRENIDQILIYFSVVTGFVLLFAQAVMLCIVLMMGSANAQLYGTSQCSSDDKAYFSICNPKDDVAYVLMDRIFGIEDVFVGRNNARTCVAQGLPCFGAESIDPEEDWPWPVHSALKTIFAFYSKIMLIVGAMILFYYIAAIVIETAQSGTPFGKRFNHIWAPLRLVFAIGLLIPTQNGINAAQYIVLYSAKFGSALATNAWVKFAEISSESQGGLLGGPDGRNMVINPPTPEIVPLVEFMTVLHTCKYAYETASPSREIKPYLINTGDGNAFPIDSSTTYGQLAKTSTTYTNKQRKAPGDIMIRFGAFEKDSAYPAQIRPLCGDMVLASVVIDEGLIGGGSPTTQAGKIQQGYFDLFKSAWFSDSKLIFAGKGFVDQQKPDSPTFAEGGVLPAAAREVLVTGYKARAGTVIAGAVKETVADQEWMHNLRKLGWGGAGIWYSKIAQMNGTLITAAQSLPSPVAMPEIMMKVKNERAQKDGAVMGRDVLKPTVASGNQADKTSLQAEDLRIAQALWEAYDSWSDAGKQSSGNKFIDVIVSFMGLSGLSDLESGENAKKHPLAQLSAVGKSMVDTSIAHMTQSGIAFAFGALGMVSEKTAGFGSMLLQGASVLFKVGTIVMSVGFLLFYIIPILPFLYFFFAVANWVKSIFEAMIGVPLWALAHLRIDGEHFANREAMGGYYLIFEIFLRPILIIFAFLGSILIFSAQASVLHDIWKDVTGSMSLTVEEGAASGVLADFRGDHLDRVFYLIVYAMLIYMIANASFKLIDIIPRSILRWMGASPEVFDDGTGDSAVQGMVGGTVQGATMSRNLLQGTMENASGAVKGIRQGLSKHGGG